ncbi:DUF4350 domain-containing protein [Pseudobacteroides cellulosolvens]|uniref:DUF4350 domain-containing protein n=1 Tax=Pseudobacteroides cellulosolvens ATCC 35603 = DSM 2933 TaxID=398512 RepID=A0A0L6JGQ6_9FIRM|nr:DUF4350 domain-containing protein [Pseudobacteroides cellulosolvens]KNY25046.1 hypothetical protein Bccel_0303 [Pseudobacteroides cellulosolvens ATCC 35603 = DSM 2933]
MRGKNIIKKIIIFVLIAAFVVLVGVVMASMRDSRKYEKYTSYSVDEDGEKALYLLTEKMGYEAVRYKKTVRFMPDSVTMVVVQPDYYRFFDETELKYMKKWIEKGNSLILIYDDPEGNSNIIEKLGAVYDGKFQSYNEWATYKAGDGRMYVCNEIEIFANEGLKDKIGAVSFVDVIDSIGNSTVYFNEYYHNMGEGVTVSDIIGFNGVLVFIQIILGIGVLFLAMSKRLGKPVVVFETVKRAENENIYALSNIYKVSKANPYVLDVMFKRLKTDLAKYLGIDTVHDNNELIRAASFDGRTRNLEIATGFSRCEQYINSDNRDINEFIYLAKWIEIIREEIK